MGFFSQFENYFVHVQCTYKVTSAASMCKHHRVVTDQHIFAQISQSFMNCVKHAYALELMRVGGGHGCWDGDDMFTSHPF